MTVFRYIPRKVIDVDGPSIFDDFNWCTDLFTDRQHCIKVLYTNPRICWTICQEIVQIVYKATNSISVCKNPLNSL